MDAQQHAAYEALAQSLEALERAVSTDPTQPTQQLAEAAVSGWQRVMEGKETIQPRLSAEGEITGAFYLGIGHDRNDRLDEVPQAGDLRNFERVIEDRLAALGQSLDLFFHREGYRSSSEQCDQMMVELARVSRFFSTCLLEAELFAGRLPADGWEHPGNTVRGATLAPPERFWEAMQHQYLLWEPPLHDAIVSWDENNLGEFESHLQVLRGRLQQSPPEREAGLPPTGYPFHEISRRRAKVTIMEPPQRQLRANSMFPIRFSQLMRKLEVKEELVADLALQIAGDVLHFTDMVIQNRFMLAGEAGFWRVHRPGMLLIRGASANHPLLVDPTDFFKKAVLFHNRTYTVAGGGVDMMYLQLRQLERYFKFRPGGGHRAIQLLVHAGTRAWEENRWGAFTQNLLDLAELLRESNPPEAG